MDGSRRPAVTGNGWAPSFGLPSSGINFQEILAKALKYLIEGLSVSIAAYFIPRKKMVLQEIVMIALTAAATFAILDLYAPSVGLASRQGAGFGIGSTLVGFQGINGLPGIPTPMVV